MSIAYAIIFVVLAVAAAISVIVLSEDFPWIATLPAYATITLSALAAAYGGCGPRVLGKRADGRRSVLGVFLLAPYVLLNSVTSVLHRLLSRESPFAQAIPGLYFGRRLSESEAREAVRSGWNAVLDLAAEFSETSSLRELPGYRSLPLLDATAPTPEQLHDAVRWLSHRLKAGSSVYVHCALGHGRTGCIVSAYLLATGVVPSIGEAVNLLRSLRPGVDLNRDQRRALRAFAKELGEKG